MNRAPVVAAMFAICSAACALPHADLRDDGGSRADMVAQPDASPDAISRPDVVEDVACPMGFVRCGSSCVNTQTDPLHCGGCGMSCPMNQECAGGACRPICAAPRRVCNGACVDTSSDAMHCGACGMACPMGQVCRSGACAVDCGALTMCGAACVDLTSSAMHCGMCNNACPMAQTCTGSACRCPTMGQTFCDPSCVDTQTDNNNCGMCGRRCMGGQTCVAGACQCPMGQHLCSGMCVSNTSVNSCGTSSCTACPVPTNGTATCNGTACGITCNMGFVQSGTSCVCPAGSHQCGATCVLNTSVMGCGTSSCTACPVPTNGTATCDGTNCGFTCNSGYMPMGMMCVAMCPAGQHLCSGTCVSNTSVNSCGTSSCAACPVPTNGTATCNGTACGFTCNSGYMPMGMMCVATVAPCGNGMLDGSEQCDDRNMTGGDGCSSSCQLETNVVRENCGATAGSLQIRSGQTVLVRGTTAGRTNDGDGGPSCQATGADIVLRVRAVDGGTLRVVATPQTAWDLVLRAGGGCPGSMCIDMGMPGGAETYTQNGVSGGTDIDLVVDGFMGASGGFDLSISLM